MRLTFPNESEEYRAARDRVLEQELRLRRMTEAVAEARRALPPGGAVPQDYVFQEVTADGVTSEVKMSELFAPGKDTLVLYSFMFSPEMDEPCPSCSGVVTTLDSIAEPAGERLNLATVSKSPARRIREHANARGWRRLRMLSLAGNSYNRDYYGETAEGYQAPMLNVFRRDGETIRHCWGSELFYRPTDPGQDPRHVDTLVPLWGLLDYTPGGRTT